MLTFFLRIKIIIISNFPSGFYITSTSCEAGLENEQSESTTFLCHDHLGQLTMTSSNLNHFGHLSVDHNLPINAEVCKVNSPPHATAWSSPVASEDSTELNKSPEDDPPDL